MNQYPCSGCGSRQCDGRCFLEDYDGSEYVEEMLHLSPLVKLQAWEVIVMAAVAMFIGYALAVQF